MYRYVIITREFCPIPPPPFLKILNFVCRYLVGLLGQTTILSQGLTPHISSSQHTGNTNTGITSVRLSRLYMWPPNKQLPHVILTFYRLHFIIQQQSSEHFNLLILLSCNFNNFVTLTKHKVKTS